MGERFQVEVGPVGHGGFCVARVHEDGDRVVFVRHTLPGERVVVEITEGSDGDRFWRADAVEVLTPSPDRVVPPCPVAGPGGCGGCDFQHASADRQRSLKGEVVSEQLRRLAGLDREVVVEALPNPGADPADADLGLRWRTRVRYATTPEGRRGMRAHRSHRVVPVEDCLLAAPGAREPLADDVITEVVEASGRRHEFAVAGDGFWQVHRSAPAVLVDTVLDLVAVRPGERLVDLYAGVGLFARFLADEVGVAGRVTAVEGDAGACVHARENLRSAPAPCQVVESPVEAALSNLIESGDRFDVVVLDPPREGARRQVVELVARLGPRAVAYVACDPAALARDIAILAECGYEMTALRAFDLFPMTHHVECVALLTKGGSHQ